MKKHVGILIIIYIIILNSFCVFGKTTQMEDISASEVSVSRESEKGGELSRNAGKSIQGINTMEQPQYTIRVNRSQNVVTVYKINPKTGNECPYKSFLCSCGKKGNSTPLGTYKTSDYYDWRVMIDNSWARYVVRFNGHILFHSVPYFSKNPENLEYEEFNKLGESASLGCVRLCVADAKWIYDNCKRGTKVYVYEDDEVPGPFGKPSQVKIDVESENRGCDPTEEAY